MFADDMTTPRLLFVVVTLLATNLSVSAHHSVSAEFDRTRRVTVNGTVTKVTWQNPHAFFFVDSKNPKTGSVVSWVCELGSPNMLVALGWSSTTLKVGMNVNFIGILARDGSHKVIARDIVADGNKLQAWPSEQADLPK